MENQNQRLNGDKRKESGLLDGMRDPDVTIDTS